MITLDGSHGEGGGQIVRTAVTLSVITSLPVHIENVRAGRDKPGLRPQHVTAIKAAAAICDALTEGVSVSSDAITFAPNGPARAGDYEFDVGTAGSASLVLQTVLLPLVLTDGESSLRVHGGTHVPNSPSGHFLRDAYMPLLLSMGADIEIYVDQCGWVPQGGGTLSGYARGPAELRALNLNKRGQAERVFGTAIGCNLPSHIPQRISDRATNLLGPLEVPVDLRPVRTRSVSTGAGLFLVVEYANGRAGVDILGRKGMPSEEVAERGVNALLAFHDSRAAVDEHLADQLVLPLALAHGESKLRTTRITGHLRTSIDVVQAFIDRPIQINERQSTVTFAGSDAG